MVRLLIAARGGGIRSYPLVREHTTILLPDREI